MNNPELYFAYGSNLNLEQMLDRCRSASPVRQISLKDWRLEFRGVADIVPCEGGVVHGAFYHVFPEDIMALDIYEGIDSGLYRKVHAVMTNGDNEEVFFFYVMNDDVLYPPNQVYYDCIHTGYEDWGISEDSLEEALERSFVGDEPDYVDVGDLISGKV